MARGGENECFVSFVSGMKYGVFCPAFVPTPVIKTFAADRAGRILLFLAKFLQFRLLIKKCPLYNLQM